MSPWTYLFLAVKTYECSRLKAMRKKELITTILSNKKLNDSNGDTHQYQDVQRRILVLLSDHPNWTQVGKCCRKIRLYENHFFTLMLHCIYIFTLILHHPASNKEIRDDSGEDKREGNRYIERDIIPILPSPLSRSPPCMALVEQVLVLEAVVAILHDDLWRTAGRTRLACCTARRMYSASPSW